MYYLPVYLFFGSIALVLGCIYYGGSNERNAIARGDRFVNIGIYYYDIKTKCKAQMFRDDCYYPYYVAGERENKNGYVILSERMVTENLRREEAKRRGDLFYKSTTTSAVTDKGSTSTFMRDQVFFRRTDTNKLYVAFVDRTNRNNVRYNLAPVTESDGYPVCHPHAWAHIMYSEIKEIPYGDYMFYKNLPSLNNEKDHGAHDMTFIKERQEEKKKKFEATWGWLMFWKNFKKEGK